MKSNLISIVMPAFNTAQYLEECLNSIINQTYVDWELLVVDDFSTDATLEVLQEYAVKDHRIKVFQNKVKGIIPALQLAYANAKGQFITRMDADDIMPENKLAFLQNALLEKGRNFVATGLVKYLSDKEMGEGFLKYEAWLNALTQSNSSFKEIYKECVIPSPCWMMYRSDFELIGAFQSNTYPEDYDLCFRMYQNKMEVVGVNEICHLWRDHQSRASRNDENYADNRFIDIKLQYFLKIDYQKQDLVLWGAGKKGKVLAQLLIKNNVAFSWLCDNPKKIGKEIYGVVLQADNTIENHQQAQVIVAVANDEEQAQIKQQLKDAAVYFFC